ncbi:LTA synthase family protein [Chitinimonas sp.]|uniref:LTA synthase family protein n=1 Tax=Chitinimonas sp. TaxID=1934313 RepID=UPI002F943745
MRFFGTKPTAVEYVLFGLLAAAIQIHLQEVFTAQIRQLPKPETLGLFFDLLIFLTLSLPGYLGLRKLIPVGKPARFLGLVVALLPPLAAFALLLTSHCLWEMTGSTLSLGLLEYGFADLAHAEKMATTKVSMEPVRAAFVALLFAAVAASVQKVRAYSVRSLLALPLLLTLLIAPFTSYPWTHSLVANEVGNKTGHVATILQDALYRPSLEHGGDTLITTQIYQTPQITSLQNTPNIIILILESTRARSVGPHSRPAQSLTPNLDALSGISLHATQAFTTTDHTSKALVGILCGMYPNPKFRAVEARASGMKPSCLAKLLRQQGYASLFLQSAPGNFEQRSDLVANMGYESSLAQEDFSEGSYAKVGYLGMDDRALIEPALHWMQKQEKPFLLTMLTSVTHHPYQLPSTTAQPTIQRAEPGQDPQEELKRYEQTIRYTDQLVGIFIDRLRKSGLLENTMVIITGDHGEAFGEHGTFTHNGIPYAEVTQIPLLIHYPARYPAGGEITGLRQHIDIVPTVLALQGASWQGVLPGKSLLSRGHDSVLSHCWGPRRCASLRDETSMLAYYYDKDPALLVNLHEDPEEKQPALLPNTVLSRARIRHILQTTKAIEKYWE